MASEKKKDARLIVMCVDKSEYSKAGWKWAVENVLKDTDQVQLIHVYERKPMSTFDYVSKDYHQLMELEKKYIEEVRKRNAEIMKEMVVDALRMGCKAHITVEILDLHDGGAKGTIQEHCNKVNPAMCIVASRGTGAFGRAFLGSVSDYLVHNLKCPVIVVKTTKSAEKAPA